MVPLRAVHLFLGLFQAALVALFATGPATSREPTRANEVGRAAFRVPGEKELLSEFGKAFNDSDPTKRSSAVAGLGDRSRTLEDKGTSKAVAKALAKGLEDGDLDVRSAAVGQLSYGREVDTTIGALGKLLENERKNLEHNLRGVDPKSRDVVERGSVLFANACSALATYRDDRSVKILAGHLASLRADKGENDLGSRLVGRLAGSALSLGTLEVVAAAVKATQTFDPSRQEPAATKLHDALAEFAKTLGATPPEWSEHYSTAWQAWLETHMASLPKKLGRLERPPMDGPSRAMDGLPGKSAR